MNKKIKHQPIKVKRISCPKCGELQLKIYPWSAYEVPGTITICKKCQNSTLKSGVA
jgi:hypothetical protein